MGSPIIGGVIDPYLWGYEVGGMMYEVGSFESRVASRELAWLRRGVFGEVWGVGW